LKDVPKSTLSIVTPGEASYRVLLLVNGKLLEVPGKHVLLKKIEGSQNIHTQYGEVFGEDLLHEGPEASNGPSPGEHWGREAPPGLIFPRKCVERRRIYF
jgi:hypothetical protein